MRTARPGWRDPRLWFGLLLVAGSVVLGARALAAVDDTTAVWVVAAERGAGAPVVRDDLEVRRLRFTDEATAERYYPASRPVPEGLVFARPVGEGELLARSAVGEADAVAQLRVPLEVDPNRVPPGVRAGSVVDVWLSDATGAGESDASEAAGGAGRGAAPALAEVTVVAAPADEDALVVSGARQIVVAVDEQRAAAFERLLGTLQDPVLRVLQRS